MTSATGGRLSQLRREQRALRYDVAKWLGNPWIFFGLLIAFALFNAAVGPLPLWAGLLIAAGLLFGLRRAGMRSWARRQARDSN